MSISIDHLLCEIGEDADLLTRSDAWLEEELRYYVSKIKKDLGEISSIKLALKIKKMLQDQNMVPLQKYSRKDDGSIHDVMLQVMKLPDAINVLEQRHDYIDELNAAGHILLWQNDGYDIKTSIEVAGRQK